MCVDDQMYTVLYTQGLISEVTEKIFKIGSMEPGAMLFEASKEFYVSYILYQYKSDMTWNAKSFLDTGVKLLLETCINICYLSIYADIYICNNASLYEPIE